MKKQGERENMKNKGTLEKTIKSMHITIHMYPKATQFNIKRPKRREDKTMMQSKLFVCSANSIQKPNHNASKT